LIEVSSDQIIFTSLDPTELSLRLEFLRPELVSLSSQSESDQIIMKFAKDFVLNDKKGNSLVFDDGLTGDDTIDLSVPLQTQLIKDSQATENLETASDSAQTTSAIVMVF